MWLIRMNHQRFINALKREDGKRRIDTVKTRQNRFTQRHKKKQVNGGTSSECYTLYHLKVPKSIWPCIRINRISLFAFNSGKVKIVSYGRTICLFQAV